MISGMERVAIALTAAVFLLSACGQAADDTASSDSSLTSSGSTSTVPDGTQSSTDQSSSTTTAEASGTLATTSSTEKGSTTSSSVGATSGTTTKGGSSTVSTHNQGGEVTRGSGEIDEGLWPFVNDAVDQLMASESLTKADITVQSAKLVQWRDASAGCPQPGMQYAQVLTDGSVIELVANDKTFWYHSGGSRSPFPCTSKLREQG